MSTLATFADGLAAATTSAAAHAAAILPAATDDPTWGNNPALTEQFLPAVLDTLKMTLTSTFFTVILGTPLALLLVQTSRRGLTPMRTLHQVTAQIVNVIRSFPFIIGIIALLPLTKLLVGTTLGWQATVVPLVLLSVPFFARLVEINLREVDPGKIEAAQMMGASNNQIRFGVQIREALPGIIQSITNLAITLIGYSAMAGAVGGGGLGQLAINYGYNRFQADVMICSVVGIIVIVMIIQALGDMLSRLVDHR